MELRLVGQRDALVVEFNRPQLKDVELRVVHAVEHLVEEAPSLRDFLELVTIEIDDALRFGVVDVDVAADPLISLKRAAPMP